MTFVQVYLIGLAVVLGPMSLFPLRVSGVTILEKALASTKPGYREYLERTSAFVPCFPRERRSN
jgi:steroid 5-alpha reductase family enzyme